MRILLDTVPFLWAVTDYDARELFVDPENEVYLSSVSTWEIAVKHSRGKEPPVRFVPAQRKQHSIDSLPLDEEATLHLSRLPVLHQDPFDRMLVCQAIVHQLVILTPDELINQYPVRTVW